MRTQSNDEAFALAYENDGQIQMSIAKGLTKREYMATHILSGIMANPNICINGVEDVEELAVSVTDILIDKLNKG